tara:strand:- start:39 stop:248 length:210 start_codon:yes stop_codon:yes gene_type:complete
VKKINQNSSTLNTDYNQNKNLEIDKIKTTNINILLNRVRQDKKKEIKKKILLSSLIFFILSLISFVIFK